MSTQDQKQINLSKRDSEIFFAAISNPAKPNLALRKAAKEYLVRTNCSNSSFALCQNRLRFGPPDDCY